MAELDLRSKEHAKKERGLDLLQKFAKRVMDLSQFQNIVQMILDFIRI